MCDSIYNEQDCILLVSGGDQKAFADLFQHYSDRIYSFALRVTRSEVVAEEIVEDVFLNVWKYRGRLPGVESFPSYLFAIARNESYKILKRIASNHHTIVLSQEHEASSPQNSEDLLITKEIHSILQQAVNQLPKQQKQVYELTKVAELNRSEVARLMKLKPETVKYHLAQAMKNIRAFCTIHLPTLVGFMLVLSIGV